jgi:hypothetical protein
MKKQLTVYRVTTNIHKNGGWKTTVTYYKFYDVAFKASEAPNSILESVDVF